MCMVEYFMMRSAGVTIALKIFIIFNPRKFLSGRSGRIDLYALWRSKMHSVGWCLEDLIDPKRCVQVGTCGKEIHFPNHLWFWDEHYKGSIPKSESLHVDTFCYCHIGKSMELIALELSCFVPQQIIHIYIDERHSFPLDIIFPTSRLQVFQGGHKGLGKQNNFASICLESLVYSHKVWLLQNLVSNIKVRCFKAETQNFFGPKCLPVGKLHKAQTE